jgi:hypothetical protein
MVCDAKLSVLVRRVGMTRRGRGLLMVVFAETRSPTGPERLSITHSGSPRSGLNPAPVAPEKYFV